jgi:hypothetical protein
MKKSGAIPHEFSLAAVCVGVCMRAVDLEEPRPTLWPSCRRAFCNWAALARPTEFSTHSTGRALKVTTATTVQSVAPALSEAPICHNSQQLPASWRTRFLYGALVPEFVLAARPCPRGRCGFFPPGLRFASFPLSLDGAQLVSGL